MLPAIFFIVLFSYQSFWRMDKDSMIALIWIHGVEILYPDSDPINAFYSAILIALSCPAEENGT